MITTLYANGCSFTAGAELEHEAPHLLRSMSPGDRFDPGSPIRAYRREFAWPNRLGGMLGAREVVNDARSGGSNARLVRLTLAFVESYRADGGRFEELLVCLGFTDLTRSERFNARRGFTERHTDDGWELIKPDLTGWRHHGANRDNIRANRAYYTDLYSERQASIEFVHQLFLLHFALGQLGVRHHFHDALGTNHLPLSRQRDSVRVMQLLDPSTHHSLVEADGEVIFAADRSFEAWLDSSGAARAPGGHPLSAGHDAWARTLLSELEATGRIT